MYNLTSRIELRKFVSTLAFYFAFIRALLTYLSAIKNMVDSRTFLLPKLH